jgi:hypothetical protein
LLAGKKFLDLPAKFAISQGPPKDSRGAIPRAPKAAGLAIDLKGKISAEVWQRKFFL